MKTVHLLLLYLAYMLFSNSLFAQSSHKTERTANGETYLIDTLIKSVTNKKNLLPDGRKKVPNKYQCDYLSFNTEHLIHTLNSVFKKVLPKERMNELAKDKKSVLFRFAGLPSGKIEIVTFIFREGILFSLEEIQQIEEELEKTFVKIDSSACSGDFFFSMVFYYMFDKHAPTL